MRLQVPGCNYKVANKRCQVLSCKYQVKSIRFQLSSSKKYKVADKARESTLILFSIIFTQARAPFSKGLTNMHVSKIV